MKKGKRKFPLFLCLFFRHFEMSKTIENYEVISHARFYKLRFFPTSITFNLSIFFKVGILPKCFTPV